ncbi:MAG: type II secretion system protein GspG [Verrucomicrobiota bacterium]
MTLSNKMRWILRITGICIVLGIVCILSFPAVHVGFPPEKRSEVHAVLAQLKIAFVSYIKEYGELPKSSENKSVFNTLTGANPKRIVFMEFNQKSIIGDEVIVDPWGTPYQFKFPDSHQFSVTSAGKDQIFGSEDDLIVGNIE